MVEVRCAHCGKLKHVFPSRANKYSKHFCNKTCQIAHNAQVSFSSPEDYCSTYVDCSGRARVYIPWHHRADSRGYALRSIVHYEYFHNVEIHNKEDIHHKDHNRLNDTKENLVAIDHVEHSKLHHPQVRDVLICSVCGEKFTRTKHRQRYTNNFCSQKCYQSNRGK